VRVVARVEPADEVSSSWHRVDGPDVTVVGLPNYVGPVQYVKKSRSIGRFARRLALDEGAFVFRSSGPLAKQVATELVKARRPYAVEVIGDPSEVFAKGALKHRLRPLIRHWAVRSQRYMCAGAAVVNYESAIALPEKYPPAQNAFVSKCSSIDLAPNHFRAEPIADFHPNPAPRLVTVGSMEQPYKGIDVLLSAVASVRHAFPDLVLVVVGDGRYRQGLEAEAQALGVFNAVKFLGNLPSGDSVRSQLDDADLFVLASRTEGLPRAMIEAMARGLPCIGTRVGGIPELLLEEDMVSPDDSEELAAKLQAVLNDGDRMSSMATRNLSVASRYRSDRLQNQRRDYYSYLRQEAQKWQSSR
jgi:glycosyltransferase involved in cell wall biosynthesis